MDDWRRDRTFSAKAGQMVDAEIYDEMLCCLPPAYWSNGIMQVGEAYSHDMKSGKPVYSTFVETEDGYMFAGYCLLGQTENCKTIHL